MDVFALHEQVIDDYRAFTSGFVEARDRKIAAYIQQRLNDGAQWPDPWVSLNPSFASGGSVRELVDQGLLHPECERIFRRKTALDDTGTSTLTLHRHQRDAVEVARSGHSYVLTTGTGSGKSLAYIVPIVDAVLRERQARGSAATPGVKAIVVYPMNALANSQLGELEKFLRFGYGRGNEPVTFERYTGQESQDERRRILAAPPDILLTNYVMLELVLTRPDERANLVRAAQGLRFLALDELHTYRGRQGADVGMLVRRLRDQCAADGLQVIGTSATMASEGTPEQRRTIVAQVATRLFGAEVTPNRVIGETLVRATTQIEPDEAALAAAVSNPDLPAEYADLAAHPLAGWAETTFGLDVDPLSGHLIRRAPTTVTAAATELATLTDHPVDACGRALRAVLQAGSRAIDPDLKRPLFAFRLHQFLSKGDTVYVSLEPESTRYITDDYQVSVPGAPEQRLLPLGFCRECGQEYLVVAKVTREGKPVFVPRRDADASGSDSTTGYLYVSSDLPWPDHPLNAGALPDSWLITDPDTGSIEIADNKRKYLPETVHVAADGSLSPAGTADTLRAWFMSTPFAFCLRCRVSYERVRGNDFGKLATLDAEGRSSAMTLLSSAVVCSLKSMPAAALPPGARKLLTFVDNRQDASLQAGHLNDFVQVAQLRGALYRALDQAGPGGLGPEHIAAAVTEAMELDLTDFADNVEARFSAKVDAERALRAVVEYRLYIDLQRGWRVTMPNLEQTGLLVVAYRDLPDITAADDIWAGTGLAGLSAERREELARILLDELRRVRAIRVDALTDDGFEVTKKLSRMHLREPWALAEDERLVDVGQAINRPARAGGRRSTLAVTARGAFGRYLRHQLTETGAKPDLVETDATISDLFERLAKYGLLAVATTKSGPEYQLNAGALRWLAGPGEHGASDPLRRAQSGEEAPRVNPFFRDLYREVTGAYRDLLAREHTAQVSREDRQEREDAFKAGTLPLLFCSPTMELGVDISDLNAVAMRNVPPTPANYAQRSGRAGRSGQQALVLTYCSTGNAHDRYWFRRSQRMVAGSVIAPRLDLTNEDLIRSHVYAVWLAETDQSLRASIPELLESGGEGVDLNPSLNIYPVLWSALTDAGVAQRAERVAAAVLAELRRTWAQDGVEPDWWHDGWVTAQVSRAAQAFDAAFERWRQLYRAALTEANEQHKIAVSTTASKGDRILAERRRNDARAQLSLLRNDDGSSGATDFYPYRYLASEGFLPGYSFPRLPLAAYIPARRGPRADGDYLQRPRFLAIREFGPGALIYHEGARYEVTRIQLPRNSSLADAAGAVTETAKRCPDCGYHHEVEVGTDVCQHCDHPLPITQHGLLKMSTVFTRRRERISSDEEERRRSGYQTETSFRFPDRGDRPGSTKADAVDSLDAPPVLTLEHGAAALVRVANVGRRRRKNPADRGYWIDLREGTWLTDKQAGDQTVDEDSLTAAQDVKLKDKVVPFVQDTRNVLVVRLAEPVTESVAVSFRTALERGIEATFELEDSELAAESLPDPEARGRMLLTEAAEGGAGVLVQLVTDPEALARTAHRALEIIHYELDETGALIDRNHADGRRERCERGCYDCLLSYGNQYEHASIDRHAVAPLLATLTGVRVAAGAGGRDRGSQQEWLHKLRDSSLERDFVDWLTQHGYRLPDDAQVTVEDAQARPDLVYRLPGSPVAVFLDGPHHDDERQRQRDDIASVRLDDAGWAVVRIRHDDDWAARVAQFEWVFGLGKVS